MLHNIKCFKTLRIIFFWDIMYASFVLYCMYFLLNWLIWGSHEVRVLTVIICTVNPIDILAELRLKIACSKYNLKLFIINNRRNCNKTPTRWHHPLPRWRTVVHVILLLFGVHNWEAHGSFTRVCTISHRPRQRQGVCGQELSDIMINTCLLHKKRTIKRGKKHT